MKRDDLILINKIDDMFKRDQDIRMTGTDKEILKVDKKNSDILYYYVSKNGFPKQEVFGQKRFRYAIVIATHCRHNLRQQNLFVKEIELVDYRGSEQHYATLIDSNLICKGSLQLYGTQVRIENGEVFILPTKDPKGLNRRRKKLGLEPIEAYLDGFKAYLDGVKK